MKLYVLLWLNNNVSFRSDNSMLDLSILAMLSENPTLALGDN
jgi:hypothetical protein